jgi:hypothetical protein
MLGKDRDVEQETLDRILRQSMAAVPVPNLSSRFDQRLKRRLHPPRLGSGKRLVLALYTVVALLTSVGLMRLEAIDWLTVAIAVAAPIAIVCALKSRGILGS